MQGKFVIKDQLAMATLAQQVAGSLLPGSVLLLKGELGSGKTVFVKALAQALGIKEDVTSPSFTIEAIYSLKNSRLGEELIHLDLYRLDGEHNLGPAFWQELWEKVEQKKVLVIIEWADKLEVSIPTNAQRLLFRYGEQPTERVVVIAAVRS